MATLPQIERLHIDGVHFETQAELPEALLLFSQRAAKAIIEHERVHGSFSYQVTVSVGTTSVEGTVDVSAARSPRT